MSFVLLAFIESVCLVAPAYSETILLTRQNNGNEQHAYSDAGAYSSSPVFPYTSSNSDPDESNTNVLSATNSHATSAVGMTSFASATTLSTSYTNVAVLASSYNPNVGVDIGGPLSASALATGTSSYASGTGEGGSRATLIVGTPTIPSSPMLMTGTLDLAFLELEYTRDFVYLEIQIGNTTIYGDVGQGFFVYINHVGAPPEAYFTEELPDDVFEFSQYVAKDEAITAYIFCYYIAGTESHFSSGGGTNQLWPEINAFAELAVNTY
ncbi:MAG: hypothetical protein V4719_02665 [Planctomycetota bacterium]